ncbi:class I SAM-dependent methyltransferase [Candidatus Albibeggiatoa sp. nov. NOAA]|uniref:SAM-dependent methyltransferase n=1 Tax=Candidatus Albibeggiatoa sp. nov. NOAA TaxID=3162724 RepID=UPI0032FB9AB7|nr:class I SAM-dependent methyltransferase [Thiotrichaceae bacterium]
MTKNHTNLSITDFPSLHSTPAEQRNLYQKYQLDEETARIAYHYDIDPMFYILVTGGDWNTYSCSIFDDSTQTLTQAQEKKLDTFARLMKLEAGQKVLDVGCGWGGPLVYLCQKYGVTGLGITVSPKSAEYAQARAKAHGVDAQFMVSHWKNLPHTAEFDAIYSDEVLVHIEDLQSFYRQCHRMLKTRGVMCHKELHLTHPEHKNWNDRLGQHVNKVFAYTGNYRLLKEELAFLNAANFQTTEIVDIPIADYHTTVDQHWLPNMFKHKQQLIDLTNEQHYKDIRLYLKCTLRSFNSNIFNQHMVVSEKID